MRILLALCLVLAMSTSRAQTAQIYGTFHKLLPNGQPCERIYLSKSHNGNLESLEEFAIAKSTQDFTVTVKSSELSQIRFVGLYDEQYPVFLRKGETLNISVKNGQAVYAGNLSKENKVFAEWYKIVAPVRVYGYGQGGYRLPAYRFRQLVDSLQQPIENFIRSINTGNRSFDREVKVLLAYSYQFDLLMPFTSGFSFGMPSSFPQFFKDWFANEKFNDAKVLDTPFAFKLLQYFSFVKHIIYAGKNGIAGEMLIPQIANKRLKAEYILELAKSGGVQDMLKYAEVNQDFLLNKRQRAALRVLYRRAILQQPGGEWINFSYPDINGQTRSLADHLGKVVLVDVWATWCQPCLAELPALNRLITEMEGKNFVVVSVSIDTDKPAWETMVKDKNLGGIHLFSNNEGTIIDEYDLRGVPRFILFDRTGKTVRFDAPRPTDPQLKELIESLL